MIEPHPQNRLITWFNKAPWRILILGILLALIVSALMMWLLMQAPRNEIATLVSTLAMTSIVSVGLGYFLYRRGWTRFPSLSLTLVMTYIWAAVLTLFNVWVMAQQMFASEHDLLLSGVLLLFAAIIATTYGTFVAATVTDSLRQLAQATQHLADGNFDSRVKVKGRDEVARVAAAFNDMASQLQVAARQREELESLRSDLIAWTSHDLRTPLTSIRVMIEALHDGVVSDPETVQRYYRTIRADIVALNTLIDDLFEMAQLDAGGLQLEMSWHDMADLVSDSIESFRPLADRRQITLDGEVGPDMVPVMMNAEKVGRVLSNLLSNAFRYTPPGGQVQVTVARIDEEIQVRVADSGPGFNPADLPRLFEQFYRGEQARSRATGGAGLGLAIARGIVEAHGGRISAENLAEGGACIFFTIPLQN